MAHFMNIMATMYANSSSRNNICGTNSRIILIGFRKCLKHVAGISTSVRTNEELQNYRNMNTDVHFIRSLRMEPVSHTESASTGTSCTSCSVQGNGKSNTVQRNVAIHSHAQCQQAHDTVHRTACFSFVSLLMHHGPG
jgi:hypothetical protein